MQIVENFNIKSAEVSTIITNRSLMKQIFQPNQRAYWSYISSIFFSTDVRYFTNNSETLQVNVTLAVSITPNTRPNALTNITIHENV